jgi:hypothetical protein
MPITLPYKSESEYDESGHLLLSPRGNPLRTAVYSDDFYLCLDSGIRFPVRILHSYGIETCQSCAGAGPFGLHSGKVAGDTHAYLEPTIEMVATADDALGFAAVAYLQSYALPVDGVAIHWPIKRGLPYEKLWRITFSRTMEDRADEKPMFIRGYQAQ